MTTDISTILQSIDSRMADQVALLREMNSIENEARRDNERRSAFGAARGIGSVIRSSLSGAGDAMTGAGNAAEGAGKGIGSVLSGIGSMLGSGGLGLAAIMVAAGLIDAQKIKDNVLTLLSIPEDAGGKLETLKDGGTIGLALFGLGKALQPFAIGGAMNAAVNYFAGKGGVEDWAQNVKDNVLTLLSIADDVGTNTSLLFEGATVGAALLGLGAGLIAFGAGSALVGLGEWITDDTWTETVKSNVTTLLSIADGLGANIGLLAESSVFGAAMTGIGAGLAVFAVGQAAEGLAQFVTDDDWATRVKDSVATLLSIADLPGVGWDTVGFVGTMLGLGTGLAAFALGKGADVAVEGVDQAVNYFTGEEDFAERIKNQVMTLLSISELPGVGWDTAGFIATMGGLALGLAAFALGKGADTTVEGMDQVLAHFTGEEDFAERIKNQVMTLLSIPGLAPEGSVTGFLETMTGLSAGLIAFGAGNLVGTLENVGTALLGFFFGVDSPFGQVMQIAEKADQLEKGANALEKISRALETFGNIDISSNKIDFSALAEDLGKAIPLLDALANGGHVKGSEGWFTNGLDFPKGILDPSLKLDEMADAIAKVNYVLGQSTTYPVNISPNPNIGARTGAIESAAIASGANAGGSAVNYAPTTVNTGGNVMSAPTTYYTTVNPATGLDTPAYLLGGNR